MSSLTRLLRLLRLEVDFAVVSSTNVEFGLSVVVVEEEEEVVAFLAPSLLMEVAFSVRRSLSFRRCFRIKLLCRAADVFRRLTEAGRLADNDDELPADDEVC